MELLTMNVTKYTRAGNNGKVIICPLCDNKPDKDNWGYVSEWTDFDGIDFNQLFAIHRELVIRRVHELSEVV